MVASNKVKPLKENINDKRNSLPKSGTTARARHMNANAREVQMIERAIEYFAVNGFSCSTRDLAKHIGRSDSAFNLSLFR